MKIVAQAPMRIDFAGGTIDLPPLFLFHYPAVTVNAATNITARVTLSDSDCIRVVSVDQGIDVSWPNWQSIEWQKYPMLELICRIIASFEVSPVQIEIQSFAPAGSGLGGSSVIAIALAAALNEFTSKGLSQAEIIEWAKSIETQAIKVPTGYQDYWAAMHGGLRAYQVDLTGRVNHHIIGSTAFQQKLQEHLMLVYTGKPHSSGPNNWELFKQHIDGVNGIPDFFEQLKEHGVLMQQAFEQEDMAAVVDIVNRDWKARKAMLPTMTTPEIESLTEKAFAAGAIALRVCGAGAGGCAMLLVSPEKRAAVEGVVAELGMLDLQVRLREQGVSIERS